MNENKVWKVRAVRPYADAHTHLFVGQVQACDQISIRLLCRTYHHGRVVNRLRDIVEGPLMTRIIPWHQVEVINELPDRFDFRHATVAIDHEGNYDLFDGFLSCVLLSARDRLIAATHPVPQRYV